MKNFVVLLAFVLPFLFAACNNDNKKAESTSTTSQQGNTPPANLSNNIEITANDSMKFSTIELNVKANEKVTLTLKNVGTAPITAMGHNWILLKDNTDLDAFEKEANTAPDHIPANNSNIIAHTKLLGPGQSDTIEFTVPAGSYTFICSFPGHYKTMTGILTAY
ncbi:plastocyanin/azurin family copper-binding protein [Flavisolibacter ginsenosidimutans]|uniref:Azurin n=1 Tax=Flavisolibacter ginsenosidimutans TaxID=661481 RepID=A0A5B8UEZ8_9BACT|nr:azurin [Flavisolibacter ginsenosidimutans]QEC54709.1 Azurin [Flavisolibacter ginsenosidimutans]